MKGILNIPILIASQPCKDLDFSIDFWYFWKSWFLQILIIPYFSPDPIFVGKKFFATKVPSPQLRWIHRWLDPKLRGFQGTLRPGVLAGWKIIDSTQGPTAGKYRSRNYQEGKICPLQVKFIIKNTLKKHMLTKLIKQNKYIISM